MVFSGCGKKIRFEVTDILHEYTIRIDYKEIGNASRVKKEYIWYWNDTILIDGIKNGPTKDTVHYKEFVDYYGLDTLIKFEKYKASHWYIKQEYEFTSW